MTVLTPKPSRDGVDPSAIINQLKEALAGKDHIIATGVLHCIQTGTPTEQILNEIKEIAQESYTMVAGLIGKQLTQTILNY